MYIRNAEKESRELMLSFGNKTVSPTSRSLVPRTPEIAFAPPRKGDMKKERDYPLLSPFLLQHIASLDGSPTLFPLSPSPSHPCGVVPFLFCNPPRCPPSRPSHELSIYVRVLLMLQFSNPRENTRIHFLGRNSRA